MLVTVLPLSRRRLQSTFQTLYQLNCFLNWGQLLCNIASMLSTLSSAHWARVAHPLAIIAHTLCVKDLSLSASPSQSFAFMLLCSVFVSLSFCDRHRNKISLCRRIVRKKHGSVSLCLSVHLTSRKFFCPSEIIAVSEWMTAPHCINDSYQSICVLSGIATSRRSAVVVFFWFVFTIRLVWTQWQLSVFCKLCYYKEQGLIQCLKFWSHPR